MNNAVTYFEYEDTLHIIDFNATSKVDALKKSIIYANEFVLNELGVEEMSEVYDSNDIEILLSGLRWINRWKDDFKIRKVEYNGETLFTGYKVIYESR